LTCTSSPAAPSALCPLCRLGTCAAPLARAPAAQPLSPARQ